MELYSKNGLLLLVQIDHLNGEIKKNRPAYVLLLDVPQDLAGRVEALIVRRKSEIWRLPLSNIWNRIKV